MKLLAFLSRRLGLLKRFRLLPLLLDTLVTLLTAVFRPSVHRRILRVCSEVSAWPSIAERLHPYGGIQFDLWGRELGHIHGNGVVDLRLPRSLRDELVSSGRALPHHTFPNSGWVTVILGSESGLLNAIELFRLTRDEASTLRDPTAAPPLASRTLPPTAARSPSPAPVAPSLDRRG